MLVHDLKRTMCLECDVVAQTVYINNCNVTNLFQKWEWGFTNQTMLENWNESGARTLTEEESN
jgi:hypothetical protein